MPQLPAFFASEESQFPSDWHLIYIHEITPITESTDSLLVRVLTTKGSTEKK